MDRGKTLAAKYAACCMVVGPIDHLAWGNHLHFEGRCPGTFMYKVVQTLRLYEQIVQQIEDSILKGDLKAGEQLPAERELAQQFGVSRTAVREAMKTLREKGLVEAYAGTRHLRNQ